jgi:hypothetical protein
MPVKKFPKRVLQDLLGEDIEEFEGQNIEIVSDKIVDNTRWSIVSHLLFKHGDKFYFTSYSRGATENQDERPFEYANAEIECPEMEQYEVVVKKYRKVPDVSENNAVQGHTSVNEQRPVQAPAK